MTTEHTSALLRDTFVELADTLASGYDSGDLIRFLVDWCSDLLMANTAGVVLETPGGTPALAAATAHEMLDIEEFEISLEQGPCLEAYRTGEQVLADDLQRCHARWPEFTPRILDLGMRSAAAFPLQLRDDRIGALNLYRREPKPFAAGEVGHVPLQFVVSGYGKADRVVARGGGGGRSGRRGDGAQARPALGADCGCNDPPSTLGSIDLTTHQGRRPAVRKRYATHSTGRSGLIDAQVSTSSAA